MNIIQTIPEMQNAAAAWHRAGRRIGCVPTMGALHPGHLSLVQQARNAGAEIVVVTIFVNPTQFGPAEDFSRYPRNFERDAQLCRGAGVDAIFAPAAAEMYASDSSSWVTEEMLSLPLCGERRPGHFRGVTTVVTKLFHAVQPDLAVFGQKDAQQTLVIQRMVRDLNFPVQIIVAPIVREADGLAMSSRNIYLSPDERCRAVAISRSLQEALAAFNSGGRRAAGLRQGVVSAITAAGGRVDYVEIRSRQSLAALETVSEPAVLAVAAYFGKTRLLDNVYLD